MVNNFKIIHTQNTDWSVRFMDDVKKEKFDPWHKTNSKKDS